MAILYLVSGRLAYEAATRRARSGDTIVILEDHANDLAGALRVLQGVDCFVLETRNVSIEGDQKTLGIEALVELTERYPRVIHWRGGRA